MCAAVFGEVSPEKVTLTFSVCKTVSRLDERKDSINNGYFPIQMDGYPDPATTFIIDYPASYHNGAAGLSFADGHAEIRKWQDSRTIVKVKFVAMPLNVPSANNRDMIWLSDRTTIKVQP